MQSRSLRALLLALLLALGLGLQSAQAGKEEKVYLNVETKKYHCLTCKWALKCTRNCIEVSRSEAKQRGGIACKVCGGTCD
jgi:hypothetical protein